MEKSDCQFFVGGFVPTPLKVIMLLEADFGHFLKKNFYQQ